MVWLNAVKFQADAKDLACAKDLTNLSVAGTNSRYITGESPPIKAGHRELLPHWESTCMRFNTSARRRTRLSAGPVRSQQLQIPPSLNSKAILQRDCLLFLLCQHWQRPSFSWVPTFLKTPIFFHAPSFYHPPKILDAPSFYHPPKILDAPSFYHPPKILKAP